MYLKRDMKCAYVRYRSQSLILEEIARKGPLSKEEIAYRLLHAMNASDKNMMAISGMRDLSEATGILINLGLLKVVNQKMSLTEEGFNALRSGTFQNLSHNAFRDYIAYRNQILQCIISVIALLISITGLILSIRSVI